MDLTVWRRQTTRCADCGGDRVVYTGEVGNQDSTAAVFGAFLYDHTGNPEVFIDVLFGTWGKDADFDDHVTFGSRTGFLDGEPRYASSLVTGGEMASDPSWHGTRLTREEALTHPRLEEFWWVNDQILQLPEVISLLETNRPRGWRRRSLWPLKQRRGRA